MRPEKKLMQEEYLARLKQSRALVITRFAGLSAKGIDRLRKELKKLEAEYLVVKNEIFKKALQDSGFKDLASTLQGPSAVALGQDNVPQLAKLLVNFEKEEGSPQIRAGMWGSDVFNTEAMRRMAYLPPRPVLLSQLLRGMQAPLAGLIGLNKGVLSGLVNVLREIRKKKEL